ncbi:hypothetical protein pb186bvf_008167 [Paramecium bursaria]
MSLKLSEVEKSLPAVKNFPRVMMMCFNIVLGSMNLGYVVTYLTLSADTMFANLNIHSKSDQKFWLSIINGIYPAGCAVGVILGGFIKKKLTNKQCLHLADFIGLFSLLTLVANPEVIAVFRFVLGLANGMSSYITSLYLKSMCPERYYRQISMFYGYGLTTGFMIGQLMGLGYLTMNGEGSQWWRIVFSVPAIIFTLRSSNILLFFNYDSPEQLINLGKVSEARKIIEEIYAPEDVQRVYEKYQNIAEDKKNEKSISTVFQKTGRIPLVIAILSLLTQMWGGSYSVLYYAAQIFKVLSDNQLDITTYYTICIGIAGFVAQFFLPFLQEKLGNRYILLLGSFLIMLLDIIVAALASYTEYDILFATFIMLILNLVVFSLSICPVCWAIVPQLNDANSTFVSITFRWTFQAILVICFPYMQAGIGIYGSFTIFALENLFYITFAYFFIFDNRGLSPQQYFELYRKPITYEKVENGTQQTQQA